MNGQRQKESRGDPGELSDAMEQGAIHENTGVVNENGNRSNGNDTRVIGAERGILVKPSGREPSDNGELGDRPPN
jgi:hypothetical protein